MDVAAIDVVFRRIIAEQAQVRKSVAHGRNSNGARFRSLSAVVSAQTQQMRYFSKSRIKRGRCQPVWRNSIANRKSRGNCTRNLRSASLQSAGVREGGS